MIINPNNSKVNVLFLFFINLVNLIINNVIIPQYTSGKIGRVNTPIMLIRVVSILKSVTIKNPKANLDAATVEAALSAFIASDAFLNEEGYKIFHSAVSGRYVNRQVQDIYTTEPVEA